MPVRARNASGELSEAAWQAQVVGLARFYSWKAFHPADNRPNARGRVQDIEAGFPDLVLVRGHDLVFAELKTTRGRVRAEQRGWLDALAAVADAVGDAVGRAEAGGHGPVADGEPAVEVHVWRPTDFEVVHARLARGRVRHEPGWTA